MDTYNGVLSIWTFLQVATLFATSHVKTGILCMRIPKKLFIWSIHLTTMNLLGECDIGLAHRNQIIILLVKFIIQTKTCTIQINRHITLNYLPSRLNNISVAGV